MRKLILFGIFRVCVPLGIDINVMHILNLRSLRLLTSVVIATFFLSVGHGAEKYHYLGCFENFDKTKLLNQYHETLETTLTPTACVDICGQKYAFAGLQKDGCFCGNYKPAEFIARSDIECDHICAGDSNLKCGAELKMSVYETGLSLPSENAIPGKVYLGCYLDDIPEFRVLKGPAESLADNTPDRCHKICYKQGFRYFGLTYMKECFCGDTIPSKDIVLSEDECNTRCSGDQNEFCGGGWRLSIYATGIPDIPENGRYVGCYKNPEGKDVKALFLVDLPRANSNRRCLNICDQKGFMYAGVHNGSRCLCFNDLLPSTFQDSDDYACDIENCPGEVTETCGSKDRTKIFRTRHADTTPITESSYLGCYKDKLGFPILEESKETFENNLTVSLCIDMCKKRGYGFSGMEYGKECYCSHKVPTDYVRVSEEECNSPCSGDINRFCGGPLRVSVHDNGLPNPQAPISSWYEGCFKDDDKNNRMLKGSWHELDNNSPDICHKHCLKTGFLYFGLTWIKECFCGDETPNEDLLLSETECQKQCGGDSNKKCGGGWRLSVYRTGLPDISAETNYKGCYRNDDKLLLKDKKNLMTNVLTPKRCLNFCYLLGYVYSGVQDGNECRCGNKLPQLPAEDEANCDTVCSGNSAETCGQKDYVKIYRTSIEILSPDTTTDETPVPSGCVTSLTSVNGELACEGQIVFNEGFEEFNNSVWSHTIKIASDPDNEFVTYTDSKEVIYIKDEKLFIKPKLVSNSFIRGSLTLENCTGKPESSECARTASNFYILPPVKSAQVTTKKSFSFRYGKMEVRAKLPIGEWITPEISLTSKDHYYGSSYASGKIRLALVRGNYNLTCGDKKLGVQTLEVGIYFGPVNGVKERVFRKDFGARVDESCCTASWSSGSKGKTKTVHKPPCKNWSSDFHNFTVIWAAEDIIFEIDGETIAPILTPDYNTVREAVQLPENVEHIYASGSRLAPFDKEFYITLGVSVGGITLFPDNCISNGLKKPWTNTSPKAMLNFWENRHFWNSTWINERSALQVEHIKVTAVEGRSALL